jgi:hypothetical protein
VPDYQTDLLLKGNFFVTALMDCTTDQMSFLFGCLLQLLVQGHEGPCLCFLESS